MTMPNGDRELRQVVDLISVNVEDEVLPRLDRIEATQKHHGKILESLQADMQLIKHHLEIGNGHQGSL